MNENYESEVRRLSRSPVRKRPPRWPPFPVRPRPVGPAVVDLRPVWPSEPPETAAGGYTPAQLPPPEGSEYVRWVQSSLNALLGLHLPLDGIMGTETRRAVRAFQQRRGLPADGIVGPDTERALLAARRSLPPGRARELPPAGEVYEDPELEEELSRSSAEYKRWVQSALNQALGLNLAVDGVFGRATRSAIRSLQRRQGLRPDGRVGPVTERALIAAGAPPPSGAAFTAPSVQPAPAPGVFQPVPVETPGGGRITDKRAPASGDLVTVVGVGGKRIPLHRLAAQAWQALVDAARADGIVDPLLLPVSGYRSPEHQARLWQAALARYGSPAEARRWVAPPGSSAHQSGRAIDFHLGGRNSSANVGALRSLPAYRWLAANAARFGFYPYSAEPWHWEYNPPAAPQRELSPEVFESWELPGEAFEAAAWEGEVSRRSPDYIRWVQGSLNRIMGLRLAVDGDLGPKTRSAIRSFQQRQGLAAHGIVGSKTEAALIAAGAAPPPGVGLTPSGTGPAPSAAPAAVSGQGLAGLAALASASTEPTIANALALIKIICRYHGIPWRLGYVILQHEGGVRLFRHHDGVMQTTAGARQGTLPTIPRGLKLALLGLPPGAQTRDGELVRQLQREFSKRLAVQIATGVQELKNNLDRFNNYVALAFQAYNAGPGWAYYTVTQGRDKRRPRGANADLWEDMCRFGASLLHQPLGGVRVAEGAWQCDANIPSWFSHIPVRDAHSGLSLVAFKYLRSIQECARSQPAKAICTWATHGKDHRQPGTGPVRCRTTRDGALDKLYNPSKLGRYYTAAQAELPAIVDDSLPLKVVNGGLVKMPLASGAGLTGTPV